MSSRFRDWIRFKRLLIIIIIIISSNLNSDRKLIQDLIRKALTNLNLWAYMSSVIAQFK